MDKSKFSLGVALVAIVIAIGGYFFPQGSGFFGAVNPTGPQHFQMEAFIQGLAAGGRNQFSISNAGVMTVGASGSALTQVIKGTGSLIMPSYVSLAATTSLVADIAVTGVINGDLVFATFATSTQSSPIGGWQIIGAAASTTSGFITVNFVNNTGVAATVPAWLASTTRYLIVR